jgi:copper oxidase (laccase) domain-containing protein
MVRFSFSDPNVIAATSCKTTSPSFPKLPELAKTPVVAMNQTHGANCSIVTNYTSETILDTDAVLTSLPNLTLSVKTADCLPILLWHPKGIIGALHAGRLGTRQHILKKTLRLLKTQFAVVAGVELVFGPAICKDCYSIQLNPTVYFDLVQENIKQAQDIFPSPQIKIQLSGRCTAHEGDFFHSYRRDGKGVPMNYSLICRGEN